MAEADDDELFAFDSNGQPLGLKSSQATGLGLSDTELHDVKAVTTAANDLEAIALVNMLEDAGIPAMKRGGIIHLSGFGRSEIAVPRKLFNQALAEIEKFRGESAERAIQDAYSSATVEEQQNDPRSPLIAVMGRLAQTSGAERESVLSEFLVQATVDAMPEPELARHLATAGLSREEAELLVKKVKIQKLELIRAQLRKRMMLGLTLGWSCAVLLVLAIYLIGALHNHRPTPIFVAAGMCIGFIVAADARSKLKALQ